MQVPLTKYGFIVVLIGLLTSCKHDKFNANTVHISSINEANQHLVINAKRLELIENVGLVVLNDIPFSGMSNEYYENGLISKQVEYLNGKRHGYYKMWFTDGLLSFESSYEFGKKHGFTQSWWRNGNIRSKSNFDQGVAHGKQIQWYSSGQKFKELNILNGKEEGLQRTWRKNGKLYNNYEAKNGRIYGLKRANLCYSLKDEEVQYKAL